MTTPTSPQAVRENFDTGPLSWVMGEIREALTKSKTAIQEAATQDAEARSTTLRHAKTYLHQAHGALQIVDVDGVAMITETIEDLLDRLEAGQIALTTENAQAAANAQELEAVPFLQTPGQRYDFPHRLGEGRNRGKLRADVHLQPAQLEVVELRRPGIHAFDFLEGDTEFVFVGAGGDLGMRARVDVRIHADSHRGDLFQAPCHGVDAPQFGFALHVE